MKYLKWVACKDLLLTYVNTQKSLINAHFLVSNTNGQENRAVSKWKIELCPPVKTSIQWLENTYQMPDTIACVIHEGPHKKAFKGKKNWWWYAPRFDCIQVIGSMFWSHQCKSCNSNCHWKKATESTHSCNSKHVILLQLSGQPMCSGEGLLLISMGKSDSDLILTITKALFASIFS